MIPRTAFYFGEKPARDFAELIKEEFGAICGVHPVQGEINTWRVCVPMTVELRKFKLLKKGFDAGYLSGSNFPTSIVSYGT
jgi:hypothetical protein